MTIQHLSRLIAAPFTPMQKDGSLNLALVPEYYAFLKRNGVTGAFINGSTGEGVSTTSKEKMQVVTAWAKATREDPDFKVMTLLGGTSLADCKDQALHAKEEGLYAVSLTSPFYFKPASVEALAECCADVAAVVPDMPFYYYHIPVLTGVGYAMIDLLKAVDGRILNFAGVKYTHEDFMDYQSCISYQHNKFDMLWGRDENMLAALAVGAKAAVGSTFNYAAPLYYWLMNAFQQGDLTQARALQQQSIDMIRLLGKYGGIATGKAYMKMVGIDCGGFRLPVRNMNDAQMEVFRTEVLSLGFKEFCSRR
ncbi:dihydrodipicolinate synthase family protein [Chitinophaga sp. Cy-1792]|uniref:dihydrodipicolinate synthase family protein n=1 Tax=Chitinophaga sp. Cy-1792 TaxID=2608339 RepID=UPI001423910B|nr:dihydrodipicolinate synthase family protein [Chitinophaga sp. Cy-1792]NIG55205.1 dihydrodipicolinate synthetase [Chitinophaga sp. Cy-1792]